MALRKTRRKQAAVTGAESPGSEDMEALVLDNSADIELPQEDESDLTDITAKAIRDVIVMPTDWTVETLLAQINRSTIDLSPKFQRRDAWTPAKKSRFIESIFMGLPVPQIVLAETTKGSFLVIDGKQRLLTLKQFGVAPDSGESFEPLRLTGLEYRPELNKQTLASIRSDFYLQKHLNEFYNQTIRTVVVKNWKLESILFLLFLRLNQNSVSLSPQELRRALHPGGFIDFADDYSSSSKGLSRLLGKVPDFRMRDVEIFIRFCAFQYFAPQYAGNMRLFLDTTTVTLNKTWDADHKKIRAKAQSFEDAISATYEIFGTNAFRKPKAKGYERSANRAIMDIMLYYFADPAIAAAAEKNKQAVEQAFRHLCTSDREFAQTIERTTKSLGATRIRFSKWAASLTKSIGKRVSAPKIGNSPA